MPELVLDAAFSREFGAEDLVSRLLAACGLARGLFCTRHGLYLSVFFCFVFVWIASTFNRRDVCSGDMFRRIVCPFYMSCSLCEKLKTLASFLVMHARGRFVFSMLCKIKM